MYKLPLRIVRRGTCFSGDPDAKKYLHIAACLLYILQRALDRSNYFASTYILIRRPYLLN